MTTAVEEVHITRNTVFETGKFPKRNRINKVKGVESAPADIFAQRAKAIQSRKTIGEIAPHRRKWEIGTRKQRRLRQ